MIDFIKKNIFVIAIFTVTLFVGFLTFLTFIDKSFIQLNNPKSSIFIINQHISFNILLFFYLF